MQGLLRTTMEENFTLQVPDESKETFNESIHV
jgi:hypothetical protein